MNDRHLYRLLKLLALLGGTPHDNAAPLASDLGIDQRLLYRYGRILQNADLAQLHREHLWCSPDQLRAACLLASEPY